MLRTSKSRSYYYNEVPSFLKNVSDSNGLKFSINNLNNSEKTYGKIARRLYAIRNSLVHNKEGENHFNPLNDEEDLKKEIPLMKAIAETVIIKYGTTVEWFKRLENCCYSVSLSIIEYHTNSEEGVSRLDMLDTPLLLICTN